MVKCRYITRCQAIRLNTPARIQHPALRLTHQVLLNVTLARSEIYRREWKRFDGPVQSHPIPIASYCIQDCRSLSWHAYACTGVLSLSTPLVIHRLTFSIYEKITSDCNASEFITWSLWSVFPANDFSVNDIYLFSLK